MAKKILKILNHDLTEDQLKGLHDMYGNVQIIELPSHLKDYIVNSPSDEADLIDAAKEVAKFIYSPDNRDIIAVIFPAGSPAFQFALYRILIRYDTFENEDERKDYLFAHSERKIIAEKEKDGSVRKTSIFEFKKWIVF